jgi:hypothetical protein
MLAAVALVAGFGVAGVASADQAGLGSNWPNAQDVSSHASFHAYRWVQNGVEFIQVNGANGAPLAAIATDGQNVMVLPVGNPSIVTTAPQGAAVQGATVYSDQAISIQATGSGLSVQPAACGDPIECSKPRIVAPAAATVTPQAQALSCGDPIECSKPVN